MTSNELRHILNDNQALNASHLPDLITLSNRCPSATVFHLLILKCMYKVGDLRFSSELQRRALYIPDLSVLHRILQDQKEEVAAHSLSHKGAAEEELNAFDLIDNFLAQHPDTGETEMISDERPYAEKLNDREEIPPLLDDVSSRDTTAQTETHDTMSIIDSFLNKGEEAERIVPSDTSGPNDQAQVKEENSPVPQPDELYTETLARIYIKQGKYPAAMRIIKSIHLKYPKKSSYFAEQLSYLEKLVINS